VSVKSSASRAAAAGPSTWSRRAERLGGRGQHGRHLGGGVGVRVVRVDLERRTRCGHVLGGRCRRHPPGPIGRWAPCGP
jgi:hypothetical protein